MKILTQTFRWILFIAVFYGFYALIIFILSIIISFQVRLFNSLSWKSFFTTLLDGDANVFIISIVFIPIVVNYLTDYVFRLAPNKIIGAYIFVVFIFATWIKILFPPYETISFSIILTLISASLIYPLVVIIINETKHKKFEKWRDSPEFWTQIHENVRIENKDTFK